MRDVEISCVYHETKAWDETDLVESVVEVVIPSFERLTPYPHGNGDGDDKRPDGDEEEEGPVAMRRKCTEQEMHMEAREEVNRV